MPALPSFSNGTEKRAWIYSHRTQRIANSLPPWWVIRQNRESVGQALISPIADQMDFLQDQADRALKANFITLAEADTVDWIQETALDPTWSMAEPAETKNHILNSSFEIWGNQSRIPDHWRATGTGSVYVEDGFLGARALSIQPDTDSSVEVFQEFEKRIPANQKWSFSCWYKYTAGSTPTVPSGYTGFQLRATLYKVDGTTETSSVNFSTSDTSEKEVSFTVSSTTDIAKIRVSVFVEDDSATFDLGGGKITVDLIQAEKSNFSTGWMPHKDDKWHHIDLVDGEAAPLYLETSHRVQFVDHREQFWEYALPTRVAFKVYKPSLGVTADSVPTADSDGITTYDSAGFFRAHEFHGTTHRGHYDVIHDGTRWKIRQIGDSDQSADIYADYDLAPLTWKQYFAADTTVEMEALAFNHGYLWVCCKTTDVNGGTKRYLAIANPKVPMPYPTYLEVPVMLELPTPSELSDLAWRDTFISRCFFENQDQQHLYVGDGSQVWAYRLYYDYYQVSKEDKVLYLRENYTQVNPIRADQSRVQPQADEVNRVFPANTV